MGSGEVGNHYVVKIDMNDLYKERRFQVWAVKEKSQASETREGRKTIFLGCIPHYLVLWLGVVSNSSGKAVSLKLTVAPNSPFSSVACCRK